MRKINTWIKKGLFYLRFHLGAAGLFSGDAWITDPHTFLHVAACSDAPPRRSAGGDEVNRQFVLRWVYFNGGNKSEPTLHFEPRLKCESGARWFHQNNLICFIFERDLSYQLCFRCRVPYFLFL